MPQESPFWLCHEMRPLMVDGVPHCASCNSEFLEILDEEVNPDPYHELPHPGAHPGEHEEYEHPLPRPGERPVETQPGFFGLLRELMGNITIGEAGQERRDTPTPGHDDQYEYRPYNYPNTPNQQPPPYTTGPHEQDDDHENLYPRPPRGSGTGGRSFRFNLGSGSAVIEIGGGARNPWVGGYDGAPGDPTRGLDSYFHGFGAGARPPRGQPNIEGMDLLQALMALVAEEGGARAFLPQAANIGDYVMTEDGFNDVLERLMQAAGPQGPLPAPEDVIASLPRFTFDEVSLKESQFDDCAVCKEDFVAGDHAMRLPCEHIYHEDCLVPWLKTNGSCPVCRKSLVPEEPRPQASRQNSQQGASASTSGQAEHGPTGQPGQQPQQGGGGAAGLLAGAAQTMITGVLNRLFGQQGGAPPSASNTATPAHSAPHSPPANAQEPEAVQNADRDASLRRAAANESSTSNTSSGDAGPPEWYRNFFAPSPDPPRTPDTPMTQTQAQAPSRQFPSSDQEIRRTPSFRSRTPTRTPSQRTSSSSRPSTPGGTYLYNPDASAGTSAARPNPLFARPFFQLAGQNGAPQASGEQAGQGAQTERGAQDRSSSPPPQLEQAARAEEASWAKDRPERNPEDDPPEPLLEELNEYRARQAQRERQQRQRENEPYVDDLD